MTAAVRMTRPLGHPLAAVWLGLVCLGVSASEATATITLFCVPDVTTVTGGDVVTVECFINNEDTAQTIGGLQIDLPCSLPAGMGGTSGSIDVTSINVDPVHDIVGSPPFGDALFGFAGLYPINATLCIVGAAHAPGAPAVTLQPDDTRYLATYEYTVSDCAAGEFIIGFEGFSNPPVEADSTKIRDAVSGGALVPFTASQVAITVDVGRCCMPGTCSDLNESCCANFGGAWDANLTCANGCSCVDNAGCNDGLFCNGQETCGTGGTCEPGEPPCTNLPRPFCSENLQVCVQCLMDTHCDDGNECTIDVCDSSGTCQISNDTLACDDGLFCNGVETCDVDTCQPGAGDPCAGTGLFCDDTLDNCVECLEDAHCDDGNECTTDVCDSSGTCQVSNDTLACDDGLFCNGVETCNVDTCQPGVGDPCAGTGLFCDDTLDDCVECLEDAHCDDGNGCTTDVCDSSGTCHNNSNTLPCEDGLFCTAGDRCANGSCAGGSENPCTDPDLAVCDETSQSCLGCVNDGDCSIGTVLSFQKISDTEGNFAGMLDDGDAFGFSVASLGDLDGDGVGDLAVGAVLDDDGGAARGAVWVLFLNTDGTVKSHQKISDTEGNFTGTLDNGDLFGISVASLGDLDGDGVGDLAVGARGDDDGGVSLATNHGAVWVLFLDTDGTVKSHQKISDTQGGFTGTLEDLGFFGSSVASLGDLDGDGIADLAVGVVRDNDGGESRGAVWVLFLNTNGTVKSNQKISDTQGGFTGTLNDTDLFGFSVASLGDLDGDGVADLAVGAFDDDDGGRSRGAVWVLFLNTDGTVKSHRKISETQGGFAGGLDDDDAFGFSVASLMDIDGDGTTDLAVGALYDDDGGINRGAVWILFLNTDGTVKAHRKISDTQGGFTGMLEQNDFFGTSVASLGDLDGDGVGDLAVGARGDDDGGPARGAVWVLFLDGVSECDGALDGTPCTDDGNPCTTDICDGAGTCVHPSDDTNDCDDGAFCNGPEECVDGQCEEGPSPCAVEQRCTEEHGCVDGCSLNIVNSDPPSGAIDARQPSDLDGSNDAGWDSVNVTFDNDASCLLPEDFVVTISPADGLPPSVIGVAANGNSATLTLDSRIPPGHWTQITHDDDTPTSLALGYLPGDVNGNGTSDPLDILALIDALNDALTGEGDPPAAWSTDVNRSGAINAQDILTVIDLLNGAGVFDPWNAVSLP